MYRKDSIPLEAIKYTPIPDGAQWLSVNGQMVFPYYGCSGGLGAKLLAYLFARLPGEDGFGYDLGTGDGVLHEEYGGKWVSVQFSLIETLESALEKTARAVKVLYA